MEELPATAGEGGPRLRVIRFTNEEGGAFTAFAALTDTQVQDIARQGHFGDHQRHVLLVVSGHSPSPQDVADAFEAFVRTYCSDVSVATRLTRNSKRPPRQG